MRDDARFDGCWPLVTNDTQMTEADLLGVYKRQPGVENRHHVLKGVVDFVPVYLKSNERIDAFALLGYAAVLVHALIERELRRAMRDADLAALALYREDRACKGPTATRVIEIFEPLCAHELAENGQILKHYDPNLSKLHRQILHLLKVPATAYQAARSASL